MVARHFAFCLAVFLAACAAQAPISEEEGTAAAGYGRIFGRVQYSYNGTPTELGMSFLGSHDVTLFLRAADTNEMQYLRATGDGTFSWPLKPGSYTLVGYSMGRTAGSYREGATRRVMAPITMPAPGVALYIGDLRVQSDKGRYRSDLRDQYEETLKLFAEKLASGNFRPVKAVLQPEPPPGNAKTLRPICAPAWALACSETNRGVEPVRPVATVAEITLGTRFPTTESLTPVLEWKPVSKSGVTYDVVIYESLSFEYGPMMRVNRLLGSRLAYAEGLTEPRYSPPTLQPGKKYEWSVRLREGDTVSNWSTTSFSLNLLIAGRSEAGQLFGFETPLQ
jgi:hypothetical protein